MEDLDSRIKSANDDFERAREGSVFEYFARMACGGCFFEKKFFRNAYGVRGEG